MSRAPGAVTHRSVLAIAVPIMLSNVSEPLIGVVDTAVIGRLPEPYFIGAIAIGSLVFSFVYWGFGFLRLGTSGLAAQAYGAGDARELAAVLFRALLVAAGCGVAVIAAGPLIEQLVISMVQGSAEVEHHAAVYFRIRVWSAPFALVNFVLMGWLIGQARASLAFALQLYLNVCNMALDALLVLRFGMTSDGVGLGTLVAEVSAAFVGLAVVGLEFRRRGLGLDRAAIFDAGKFRRTFVINFDIMIRTWCLVFAFWWHAAQGAKAGDVIVSANAVLINLFEVAAYLVDGFAYAAEALVGQSVGARDRHRYRDAVAITTWWALAVGTLLAVVIYFGGPALIDALATNVEVRATAKVYLPWVALSAIAGVICFQLDGIFTGATRTADMRNMMALSLAVYLAVWWIATRSFGNHGLWLALNAFFIIRAITLGLRLKALEGASFPPTREATANP
ncbi:MAG: MATE family efflux transporter [Pseudomonadota bacterium]|nr:MATE family efflux transporter [Pseudomonadota bacterium]